MTIGAAGFAAARQSVRIEVGEKRAVSISLTVGSVRQGVDVTATSEVLHTSDASVGEVVEPQSIHDLPLNGRMLIDLLLTVPGAHVGFGPQTGSTTPLYWRPGHRSAVVICGSRPNTNFFLLAGPTNPDPTLNPHHLSPPPPPSKQFHFQP